MSHVRSTHTFDQLVSAIGPRNLTPTRPRGFAVTSARPEEGSTPLNAWFRFLEITGFRFEYTPNAPYDFTLHGARPGHRKVHLVMSKRRRKASTILADAKIQDRTPDCCTDAKARLPEGCERCNTEDWTVAIGPVLWLTSNEFQMERHENSDWEWYRDVAGVAVSGNGLRTGEYMSIAQCPICSLVSIVPLDGWTRHDLHSCGHQAPGLELAMLRAVIADWVQAEFPSAT